MTTTSLQDLSRGSVALIISGLKVFSKLFYTFPLVCDLLQAVRRRRLLHALNAALSSAWALIGRIILLHVNVCVAAVTAASPFTAAVRRAVYGQFVACPLQLLEGPSNRTTCSDVTVISDLGKLHLYFSVRPAVAYLGGGACASPPPWPDRRDFCNYFYYFGIILAPFIDKIAATNDQMRFFLAGMYGITRSQLPACVAGTF